MGDGDEAERMLKEWGLIGTIEEMFSKTMDTHATQVVPIELDTKEITKALQRQGVTDINIIGYLEDLENGSYSEITISKLSGALEYEVFITFYDGRVLPLTL